MTKYLYFRAQATIGNDDATGDSACYPISSLLAMQPTADDTLTLYFKQLSNIFSDSAEDADADEGRTDTVDLTIPVNTHKTAMKVIADAIVYSNEAFVVVGDNLSSDTEYLNGSGITAIATITVRGIND